MALFPGSRRNMGSLERGLHAAGGAALLYRAIRARSPLTRAVLAAAGGTLLYSGASGHAFLYRMFGLGTARHGAARLRRGGAIHVVRTILIDRPAEQLYGFWRDLENLPRIMRHLESVRTIDSQRSHWTARGPLGRTVEWDAEITHDVPGRELGWRSLPGAEVESAGIVRFQPSPLGSGTQLQVEMQYSPPAGRLGGFVARLLGEEPRRQIDDDLQRFKLLMEGRSTAPAGPGDRGELRMT